MTRTVKAVLFGVLTLAIVGLAFVASPKTFAARSSDAAPAATNGEAGLVDGYTWRETASNPRK